MPFLTPRRAPPARSPPSQPYDFMFWTNVYMFAVATVLALVCGEVFSGMRFCAANPLVLGKITRFAACSAAGQSFIFYTIANFDPLVCSTVTTTRKIFSVLLSIFTRGHKLNAGGWAGLTLACSGILSELIEKASRSKSKSH